MEAVARQYATDKLCLVIRNGMFSYRWTQIFDTGRIPRDHLVVKARRYNPEDPTEPFHPPPIDEVIQLIETHKPDLVFVPHVETSAGLILPKEYLQRVALAVHEYGGMLILDCIASGCLWVDMKEVGVDILISAPQKGCLKMILVSFQRDLILVVRMEFKSWLWNCDVFFQSTLKS
jgi:aspartate aminotransferase-like enzyme